MKQLFRFNKNFWAKEIGQGAHSLSRRQGAPYRARPYLLGPLVGLRCPSCAISSLLPWKNRGQAYGMKLRRHEAEPWRNQSRALAELFCRGHFPLGGGNHHQTSSPMILSSRGGQSPSTSSLAPCPLKTLVHLLYPILYQNHKLVPVGC